MTTGRCSSGGACPPSPSSSLRPGAASSVKMSTSLSATAGLRPAHDPSHSQGVTESPGSALMARIHLDG